MAILFELWVECANESACLPVAAHFQGYQFTLLTGRTVTWEASILGPPRYPSGVVVVSNELSKMGVRNLQDALETTESGLRLLHRLISAPGFRFARVDWDAENIPVAELTDFISEVPNGDRLELECVIDEELYEQLGKPANCFPFREGYWWTRYNGEEYKPLYSNDQPELNAACRNLFPEYFTL